jgi:hypothetical protein
LKPCPGCNRHVRTTERACPFCGSVSSLALFEPITELRLVSRLDRSRMVALGALLSAAGIALGCREAPVADAPPLPPAETQHEAPAVTAPPPASSVSQPAASPSASVAPHAPPAPTHVAPPKPTASARPFAPAAAYGAPPSMNPLPNIEPRKP